MRQINQFKFLIKNKITWPSEFNSGGFFFAYEKNITFYGAACFDLSSSAGKNKF